METSEDRPNENPVEPEPLAEMELPVIPATTRAVPGWDIQPPGPPPRPSRLPLILFVATCLSTWWVGGIYDAALSMIREIPQVGFRADLIESVLANLVSGLGYAVSVMAILLAHELGHFLQARRYRVPATLPFFIPMPIGPTGTMGAVIAMRPGVANRKALFDIAITGPLAGLVPALVLSVVGLKLSQIINIKEFRSGLVLGHPILFQLLVDWFFGPLAKGQGIILHPIAYAGWVGIFITALNLIPIGQLDGGHILYALLRQKAHPVALCLLCGAAIGVFLLHYWGWTLMIAILIVMGPKHPPTSDDHVPLGPWRVLLGWLALLFVLLGFTPTPFMSSSMKLTP